MVDDNKTVIESTNGASELTDGLGLPKEYKFKTFQEAYDVVPADKLAECFEQIGLMLAASKSLDELRIEVEKMNGNVKAMYCKLPESLGWIDDGKCEIDVNVCGIRLTNFDPN